MTNTCPYCKAPMIGIEGSKICSNLNCGAYQVDPTDPNSYDKKLSKQEREERKNERNI